MTLPEGRPVPGDLLDAVVLDAAGASHRLGDRLRGPSLLIFLRHFG